MKSITKNTNYAKPNTAFDYANDGKHLSFKKKWVADGDFRAIAMVRDFSSNSWGILCQWEDLDGVTHEKLISKKDIFTHVINELIDEGLYIHDVKLLQTYLSMVKHPDRITMVEKPGWVKDAAGKYVGYAFSHFDDSIMLSGQPRVEIPQQYAFKESLCAGTFDEWKTHVAMPCKGQSRLVFSLATALLGPLLEIIGAESGGVNMVGSSSIGKTTGLHAANSLSGHPMKNWKSTGNALENTAGIRNNSCLCIDELKQCSPSVAGAAVYMFSQGEGKDRMDKSGGNRPNETWSMTYQVTSEITLQSHIESSESGGGSQAGHGVRLIEVDAESDKTLGCFDHHNGFQKPSELADHIKKHAQLHRGHAGRLFIEKLLESPDLYKEHIEKQCKQIEDMWIACVPSSNGQISRVINRFALIATAGELAITLGVLPYPAGHVIAQVSVIAEQWAAKHGSGQRSETTMAIQRMCACIDAHEHNKFHFANGSFTPTQDCYGVKLSPTGEVVGPKAVSGVCPEYHIYFTPSAWKEVVIGSLSVRSVNKELKELGIIEPDPTDGKSSQLLDVPGMAGNKKRYYHVDPDKLNDFAEEQSRVDNFPRTLDTRRTRRDTWTPRQIRSPKYCEILKFIAC